jgi:hypothetical protein
MSEIDDLRKKVERLEAQQSLFFLGQFTGVRTAAPFCPLEILGTGSGAWPASSGTADANVVLRVHTNSVGLDFGTHNSGMSWLQNRLASNLATNFAIILNPVGGGAGVGLYGVPVHANNDAAVAAGMMAGMFYRTGGNPDYLCIVH